MRSVAISNLAFILLSALILSSCANTQKVVYFRNLQDSIINNPVVLESPIQKNDILSISVSSLNPEASALFNMANVPSSASLGSNSNSGGSSSSSISAQGAGYLVSLQGYIQFPILGEIKAAGMTKKQLEEDITRMITDKKLLTDPIISVRQVNYHVTVLGEVAHPTVVSVPSEKINILEALGLAGDLTIFGNRETILLIREENGRKTFRRINLNSSDILSSPFYYLNSNDIIYVEPNKNKVVGTSTTRQVLPIILSTISIVAIVVSRLIK